MSMEEYFLITNTTVFIFWYSYMITNFKLRIFLIFFFFIIKVSLCDRIYINRLHFNFAMIFIVALINHIINIHSFWYWSHILVNFVLLGSNKSFSSNRFSFIMRWIHFYFIILYPDFIDLLQNSLPLFIHILFGLRLDSSKFFLKSIFIFQRNNSCIFTININNAW